MSEEDKALLMELATLKSEMENLRGQWDGDNPGIAEDRASLATDIIDAVTKLESLLEKLEENS
jgi:hypothetical protein